MLHSYENIISFPLSFHMILKSLIEMQSMFSKIYFMLEIIHLSELSYLMLPLRLLINLLFAISTLWTPLFCVVFVTVNIRMPFIQLAHHLNANIFLALLCTIQHQFTSLHLCTENKLFIFQPL